MLQSTIQDALNKQIAMEMYASNLYLAMSAHFAAASLKAVSYTHLKLRGSVSLRLLVAVTSKSYNPSP